MKHFLTSLVILLATITSFAQAPNRISYQAEVRNGSNNLVVNQLVGIRISILQGSIAGASVYTETHAPTTNANGLVSLQIGGGTVVSGGFASINWGNGPYFLKTETDPTGGTNYTITGTNQLLSVPYALFSNSSNTSNSAANGLPAGGTQGQVITMCNGTAIWTTGGVCPGTITALNCASAVNTGTLTLGTTATSVSSSVPYTGGNGGSHNGQTVTSTGVTGLTATLTAGSFTSGAGNLTYTITGTPASGGTASFALNIGGRTCTLTRTVALPVGTISALTCASATNNGTLTFGVAAASVSSNVPYTGGNGGTHNGQTVTSTGVTGLTATLTAGTFAIGAGSLTYTITGTPASGGTASFALNIGGRTCTLTRTVNLPVGSITALNCTSSTNSGTLTQGTIASSVSSSVPYTGGNGGTHNGQTVTSTGVTGLTATLTAGTFLSGAGSLTYTITGTPASSGTASFALNIGGKTCTLTRTVALFVGTITALSCASATNTGALSPNVAAISVSSSVPYTGGNGGSHNGQTVTSTGIYGLTATCLPGTFANGAGTLIYTITGTPQDTTGIANFALNIGGRTCNLTRTVALPVGTISALTCASATNSGTLVQGIAAANVSSNVPYTGGNGGTYTAQTITSTGVTGLTATRAVGNLVTGAGIVTYTITGTPSSTGTASFAISLGGQSCTLTRTVLPVASVTALSCATATNIGTLTQNIAASSISSSVPYTGGNGGYRNAQTVTSTGVTGLTATCAASTLATGAGSLTYTITGTPTSTGTASFAISIGGQTCTLTRTVLPFASITALSCASATNTGALNPNVAASGVSSSIPYTGGNGLSHNGQTVTSTGIYGLTATCLPGTFANGAGTLVYTITGTPQDTTGIANFALNIGGQTCNLTRTVALPVGTVSALTCASATNSGALVQGVSAANVSSNVPYTGGNGGTYTAQTITSTGVTGLTATRAAGNLVQGAGILTYTITGTPSSTGTASFAISVGGQSCTLTRAVLLAASVTSLNCSSATNNGTLTQGVTASSVNSSVPYTGGNGGYRGVQTVTSTGVNGLTATCAASTLASGAGSLTYTISGTPASSGIASFVLSIGGQTCTLTRTVLPSASITALSCATATNIGALTLGVAASGVSSSVPYTGGNGGTHNGQTITSTGVYGLTATRSPGTFANGAGTLVYTITGTPQDSTGTGIANFALNIGGQTCTLTRTVLPVGTITALNCASVTNSGALNQGVTASSVSSTVPYTGGNGGTHNGQTVSSTGVTGLTATLTAGTFANGSGTLVYTITGTPASSGTASFALNIGGRTCTITRTVN
jgi:hypothetical protein